MAASITIATNWKIFVIQGVLALIFALLTWFYPEATLGIFIFIFAAFFILDGATRVWLALQQKKQGASWGFTLCAGLLGLIAGIATLSMPAITTFVMLYLVAFWAIAIGVLEIVAGFSLKKHLSGYIWLIISGFVSVIFGAYLSLNPSNGILTMLWLVAIYAAVFGVLLIWFGLKLKSMVKEIA